MMTLKDIIDENSLNILADYLKSDLIKQYPDYSSLKLLNEKITKNLDLITFDQDNLSIYFNPLDFDNKDILKLDVPLSKLNTKITFEEDNKVNKENNYTSNLKEIDINMPMIALTFDDGPSKYTTQILDVLNEYGATATFFVLGNKVEIYEDTMKKMVALKNEVGNHTYNHRWITRLDNEEFKDQIEKTQDIIEDVTGYTPINFRPTYGSINKRLRENVDLNIVMWTIDSKDWKIRNSKKIADRLLKSIKDGDIILMHDTYERTLKAVKIILPELIEKGYQFVTISTLEKYKSLKEKE